ncbi:MAG: hypothetical protein RLZZ621_2455 [Gemmatimonadota bacterium]
MTSPIADPLFLAFQQALAGRYSIDRELGRGGMGIVYLAREVDLDRLVAIKLLPPDLAHRGEVRSRFLQEARTAANLSHPHIVPIHAVDQVGDFVYFVMAYVDGETLAQRVQGRGPVAPREATRWLRETAWALSYAHGRGVIHRDIKPDNILIERESGRALVADFGIAADIGDQEAGRHGTPEFMSPEQALGAEPGAASDLYALGITAYYTLTGRVPFTGDDTEQILQQQCTAPVPSMAANGVVVPRKVAQLVERCLAKTPEQRPASAQAVADQLGSAMADRRELPAVLRAFVKRTGRLDGGGTVLTLLGALGLAIVVASWLGPLPGVVTLLVSMVLAPVLYAVYTARQFQLQGFAHADLAPAFASELEVLREEWSVQPRRGVAILEWGARSAARVLATTTIALTPLAVLGNWLPRFEPVTPLVLLFAAAAAAATIAWLALLQLRREVDLSFWRAVWTGRFGETVFAVARRFRGRAVVVPAMTHRATELSLSLAAEQLFESLPREAKHALGDMPAVLQRLQRDAHQLRTRLAQLQEILAVRREETADDVGRTALEREHTRVRAQLQDTVAALETLRLGLLRLHAGAMSIEGLTTHLDVAAALSDDVMRLAAANEDVEQMLRHDAVPTPV